MQQRELLQPFGWSHLCRPEISIQKYLISPKCIACPLCARVRPASRSCLRSSHTVCSAFSELCCCIPRIGKSALAPGGSQAGHLQPFHVNKSYVSEGHSNSENFFSFRRMKEQKECLSAWPTASPRCRAGRRLHALAGGAAVASRPLLPTFPLILFRLWM